MTYNKTIVFAGLVLFLLAFTTPVLGVTPTIPYYTDFNNLDDWNTTAGITVSNGIVKTSQPWQENEIAYTGYDEDNYTAITTVKPTTDADYTDYAGNIIHYQNSSNYYTCQIRWDQYDEGYDMILSENNGGTENNLATANVGIAQGTWYKIKTYTNNNDKKCKVWENGTTEPENYDITITDATLTTGQYGVIVDGNMEITDYNITRPPQPQPPESTIAQLTTTYDTINITHNLSMNDEDILNNFEWYTKLNDSGNITTESYITLSSQSSDSIQTQTIYNLESNTTYGLQSCINADEITETCSDEQFITTDTNIIPNVTTNPPGTINYNNATVNMEVTPNHYSGDDIEWYFQYKKATVGTYTESPHNTVNIATTQSYSTILTGLDDGTNYDVKACVDYESGTQTTCGETIGMTTKEYGDIATIYNSTMRRIYLNTTINLNDQNSMEYYWEYNISGTNYNTSVRTITSDHSEVLRLDENDFGITPDRTAEGVDYYNNNQINNIISKLQINGIDYRICQDTINECTNWKNAKGANLTTITTQPVEARGPDQYSYNNVTLYGTIYNGAGTTYQGFRHSIYHHENSLTPYENPTDNLFYADFINGSNGGTLPESNSDGDYNTEITGLDSGTTIAYSACMMQEKSIYGETDIIYHCNSDSGIEYANTIYKEPIVNAKDPFISNYTTAILQGNITIGDEDAFQDDDRQYFIFIRDDNNVDPGYDYQHTSPLYNISTDTWNTDDVYPITYERSDLYPDRTYEYYILYDYTLIDTDVTKQSTVKTFTTPQYPYPEPQTETITPSYTNITVEMTITPNASDFERPPFTPVIKINGDRKELDPITINDNNPVTITDTITGLEENTAYSVETCVNATSETIGNYEICDDPTATSTIEYPKPEISQTISNITYQNLTVTLNITVYKDSVTPQITYNNNILSLQSVSTNTTVSKILTGLDSNSEYNISSSALIDSPIIGSYSTTTPQDSITTNLKYPTVYSSEPSNYFQDNVLLTGDIDYGDENPISYYFNYYNTTVNATTNTTTNFTKGTTPQAILYDLPDDKIYYNRLCYTYYINDSTTTQCGEYVQFKTLSELEYMWEVLLDGSSWSKILAGFFITLGILFVGVKAFGSYNVQLGTFGIMILVLIGAVIATVFQLFPTYILLILLIGSVIMMVLKSMMFNGNNGE